MRSSPVIRPAAPHDEANWVVLWRAYCGFYETEVPDRVTAHTWGSILNPAVPVGCLVADDGGRAAGFATFVIHPYTWSEGPACYLEDLFVSADDRGLGIGRALIEGVRAEAVGRGCTRLYWMTKEGNTAARRLYDALAQKDDFVRYVMPLS